MASRPERSDAGLHANLTREVRSGPAGAKVGAFFDVDRTLLAGFSAAAFVREQLFSGRVGANELAEMTLGALGYALGQLNGTLRIIANTSSLTDYSRRVAAANNWNDARPPRRMLVTPSSTKRKAGLTAGLPATCGLLSIWKQSVARHSHRTGSSPVP